MNHSLSGWYFPITTSRCVLAQFPYGLLIIWVTSLLMFGRKPRWTTSTESLLLGIHMGALAADPTTIVASTGWIVNDKQKRRRLRIVEIEVGQKDVGFWCLTIINV